MKRFIKIFIFLFSVFLNHEGYALSNDSLKNEIYINGETFSQGMLSLSSDKKYLTLYGYSKYGLLGGNSSAVDNPRALVLINNNGEHKTVSLTNVHGNAAARGVAVQHLNNNNYQIYLTGSGTSLNNGLQSVGIETSSFSQVGVNERIHGIASNIPKIFDNKLYIASSSSDSRILNIGALDSVSGILTKNVNNVIGTGVLTDPLDFMVFNGEVLYVADKNIGIRKFYLNSGSWIDAGHLNIDSGKFFISVIGRLENGIRTLYAVTDSMLNNSVVKIEDSSNFNVAIYNGSPDIAVTRLLSAGPDKGFRGISFAPEPTIENNESTLSIKPNSFSATITDTGVKLTWRKQGDKTIGKFEILKSSDHSGFVKILAQTSGKAEYSYTDRQPVDGVNYYQLKYLDENGFDISSQTIQVAYNQTNKMPDAYINSYSELIADIPADVLVERIIVSSIEGSLLFTKNINKTEKHLAIPLKHYKGVLIVRFLLSKNHFHTIKLIK